MKIGVRGLLVGVLLLVAVLTLSRVWWKPHPIGVEVGLVEIGPVETLVTNSEAGTVRSRAVVRLASERSGRVVSIAAREGDSVKRGAVVVRLDTSTARARLDSARREFAVLDAAHDADHADARLARQEFERTRALRERGLVADDAMDAANSRLASAESALRAAEARRAAAEATIRIQLDELAHLEVRAPFDGVVARRFVELGESVTPAQPMLEIVDLDRLYVSAPIDERDAAALSTGRRVRVTVDTFPGRTWNGSLTRVSPVVEETQDQNRTIEVEVDLDAALSRDTIRVRPGMTADLEVVLDRRDDVLRVPTPGVIDGRSALVLSGGRAVSQAITVGSSNGQWTEVTSGLAAGDSIITSLDRAGLKPGARVRRAVSPRGAGP